MPRGATTPPLTCPPPPPSSPAGSRTRPWTCSTPPSAITRPTHSNAPRDPSSPVTGTIIDLVLCSHYHLLSSISQDSTYAPRSDHLPFLVQLALPSHQPGDRPPVDRTRTAWDVHCAVEAWQAALPVALTAALQPLQRSLRGLRDDSLAGSTPQQALDTTYNPLRDHPAQHLRAGSWARER